METIPPLGREAIDHARRGDFEQAIATARRAITAHSNDFGLRVFLAMLHVRRGELGEALPHLRAAIAIDPRDPFPRLELVRVLTGLGEVDEASELLDQLRLPGPEPLRLRAMLLHRRGEVAEACKLYRQLVDADPRDFESWGNLGLCLLATDRPQEAVRSFERSLALRPDRLSIRLKWAEAHLAAGTGDEALAGLHRLANSSPADATLLMGIAHLEDLLGHPQQALETLEEAVRKDGANAEALVALAEKLEQLNDLERYEETLARLAALPEPGGKLPLLQARLAFRRKDFGQALKLAQSASSTIDAGTRAQLIGQSLDRLGDAAAAFDAFVEMNSEDARTGGIVASKARESRSALEEQRRLLTPEWVSSWCDVPPPDREPAFLVGFPRSGTTLLDTLLMGHPATAVAEEEPMLSRVGEELHEVARLASLGSDEVQSLRGLYFQVAEQFVPEARQRLLVDKNPFAMGSLPIIHRLFPTAPVIFMERHPCDVVLSCFMMRFQPTGIGTNFLTLEDTALVYDEMMQLWSRSAEVLPLKLHRIRYERLVEDLEGEVEPLVRFLGLEWIPELLDHSKTVRKRAFIKTPSYAQVTEPVSRNPVGRWNRYRKQLEPILPVLEPWARRMGYEL